MAWRIAENIVRGAIDNRLPGIIKGTLYLEGLRDPLILELEGNCDPDLAGRHLTFRNLMPQAGKNLEGLCRVQCGTPGTMTANRMVRIPSITPEELEICLQERRPFPTRWSESLYLEWFASNGRVVVEGAGFTCQLTGARWRLSEEAHQWNLRRNEREFDFSLIDPDETGSGDESSESEEDMPDTADACGLSLESNDPPHPLVRQVSDLLLRTIDGYQRNKVWSEDAINNQPIESMIDELSAANTRLAMAMARAHRAWEKSDRDRIVHELNRTRWSLAQARENAGLAAHMGSAHKAWLKTIRREFVELRREIRTLTHEFEEPGREPAPAGQENPTSS